MTPKLTIICMTYNHAGFIAQALASFIAQKTNFAFEIFVGDDASTDGTADIVREWAARYPQIRPFFHEKNVGFRQNLCDIASQIRSEYVAICEGDDYYLDEQKLQKQVDFLDANRDYAVCFGAAKVVFEGFDKAGGAGGAPNSNLAQNTAANSNLAQNTVSNSNLSENQNKNSENGASNSNLDEKSQNAAQTATNSPANPAQNSTNSATNPAAQKRTKNPFFKQLAYKLFYFYRDTLQRLRGKNAFSRERLLRVNFITNCTVVYRWGFGANIAEQLPECALPLDLYCHLYHAQRGKIGKIDGTLSVYRRHPGGMWSSSLTDLQRHFSRNGLTFLGLHAAIWREFATDKDAYARRHILPLMSQIALVLVRAGELEKLAQIRDAYPEFYAAAWQTRSQVWLAKWTNFCARVRQVVAKLGG